MKILFASQSFYPYIGGVSTHLLALATGLHLKGHQVEEIHLRTIAEKLEGSVRDIPIHRIPQTPIDRERLAEYTKFKEKIYNSCHGQNMFDRPAYEIEGYEAFHSINMDFGMEVRKHLDDQPSEVVHVHDFQLLFLYKFIPRGTPLILTWHIPFLRTFSPYLKRFLISHMSEYDKVIFSLRSYCEAAIDAGLPREKVVQIYPMTNTKFFRPMRSRGFFKKAGLTGKRVILCVQRVDVKSGHEQLIRAMPIILKSVPNAMLVFISSKSMSDKLSKERKKYWMSIGGLIKKLKIRRKVAILDGLSDDELLRAYNSSDVVALTSRLEGFGLSVTEAMACGKPLVVTRSGGMAEQVVDGKNGFLVECGDCETTGKRISQILLDSKLRRRMGANSLSIVKERFSTELGVTRHLRLYRETIRSKTPFWSLRMLNPEEIDAIVVDFGCMVGTGRPKVDNRIIEALKASRKKLILVTSRELSNIRRIVKKAPIWECIVAENGAVTYFPQDEICSISKSVYSEKAKDRIKRAKFRFTSGEVVIRLPRRKVDDVKKALGSKLCKELNFELSRDRLIIVPKNVDFDTTLLECLARMKVKPESILILGQGENVADLFNIPGYKVSFSDSAAKIRELADEVIPLPATSGLSKALEMLFQEG